MLALAVRAALALSEKDVAFKGLTEGSDGRSQYIFKPERFDPSNATAVADVYTADAFVAVVAAGRILCLETIPFTLDVMV